MRSRRYWVSLAVGVLLFAVTIPFYHDMYIAPLFTALCVCLNGVSAVLFAFLLCYVLKGEISRENCGIFLWFLVLQAVGHIIFAAMNWGSWLFLGLSLPAAVAIAVFWRKGN